MAKLCVLNLCLECINTKENIISWMHRLLKYIDEDLDSLTEVSLHATFDRQIYWNNLIIENVLELSQIVYGYLEDILKTWKM